MSKKPHLLLHCGGPFAVDKGLTCQQVLALPYGMSERAFAGALDAHGWVRSLARVSKYDLDVHEMLCPECAAKIYGEAARPSAQVNRLSN